MAELIVTKSQHTPSRWLPGLLLTAAIAAVALLAGSQPGSPRWA